MLYNYLLYNLVIINRYLLIIISFMTIFPAAKTKVKSDIFILHIACIIGKNIITPSCDHSYKNKVTQFPLPITRGRQLINKLGNLLIFREEPYKSQERPYKSYWVITLLKNHLIGSVGLFLLSLSIVYCFSMEMFGRL